MAVIMRDAIKPNLLQTLENTPVLVHAGPFGNIAHGNSSVVADLIGIHSGDYLVTEAGFGADMGAERFFNIKCRTSGLRAGRRRGRGHRAGAEGALRQVPGSWPAGRCPPSCSPRTPTRCTSARANLRKQIENIRRHGVTPVVAINAFPGDFASEHAGDPRDRRGDGRRGRAVCTHFADGGRGAVELAEAVAEAADEPSTFQLPLPGRGARCARRSRPSRRKIYGADGVDYSPAAAKPARQLRAATASATCRSASPRPTCRSRRDPTLKGAPTGWTGCRSARCAPRSAPASSTRSAATCAPCPASVRSPAAISIDIDDDGEIVGLY